MLLQQHKAMQQLRSRLRALMVFLSLILYVAIILALLPILILILMILTIRISWLPPFHPAQPLQSKWDRPKVDREPVHPEE